MQNPETQLLSIDDIHDLTGYSLFVVRQTLAEHNLDAYIERKYGNTV
jgi:hypothetical protein